MKLLTLTRQNNNDNLSANFHLMIGSNLFTNTFVRLETRKKCIKISGKWAVNKETKVNISEIDEIREGLGSDTWIELKNKLKISKKSENTSHVFHFSIILRSTPEIIPGTTIDLFTQNETVYEEWMSKLNELLQKYGDSQKQLHIDHDTMLKWYYKNEIKRRHRDIMPHQHLRKFIHDVNIAVNSDDLDIILDLEYPDHHFSPSFETNKFLSKVTYGEFFDLMEKFDCRTGLDFVFYKYSIAKSEFMNAKGLQRFFNTDQYSQKSLSECEELISKYSEYTKMPGDIEIDKSKLITRKGFYRLFEYEQELHLFDPMHRDICQNMEQPMSHYFIASSHNSYLTGNQITSASSYEMYRRILLDGCRCLEIDVWDGWEEPEVFHGHTMTSKILLRGVLEVIAEVAFENSEYPIILSIENHLNKENQGKMAQMMRKIFKDKLYIKDVPDDAEHFLSPNEFKGFIFIKGSKSEVFKLPPEEEPGYSLMCLEFKFLSAANKPKRRLQKQNSVIQGDFDSDDDDIDEGDDEPDSQSVSTNYFQRRRLAFRRKANYRFRDQFRNQRPHPAIAEIPLETQSILSSNTSLCDHNDNDSHDGSVTAADGIKFRAMKSKVKDIDKNFSSLINYFKTKKFTNIQDVINEFKFYEMVSRDESASKRIYKASSSKYRQFTSTNMVRVYPHGLRQDSSNYMPLDHWDVGAQMVALNYQTISVPMLINWAQFELNGGCGYVLKPQFLRTPGQCPVPQPTQFEKSKEFETLPKTILEVQILSGQFWNQFDASKFELKVSTRVYCPDKEKRMDLKKPESTKVIQDNGFNPVWNETFTFDLSNPELSFVQFTLVNSGNFVGHHMIAFQAMQKGYRYIDLFDHDLKPIPFARIYVHTDHWIEGEK